MQSNLYSEQKRCQAGLIGHTAILANLSYLPALTTAFVCAMMSCDASHCEAVTCIVYVYG
jgi:hypothetical protein